MTNNSIFTRVLALMICLVMLVGTLTACFNEVDGENHTGTTTNGEVTTKPTTTTTTTTTTGDVVEDEPTEDPVDPNVIFSASTNISSDSLIYGTLASDVVIGGAEMGALVPADVKVEAGASNLALSVKKVDEVLLSDALSALDVHINGVALDNTVPMIVKLGAILEAGLGATELKLYHTENGVDNLMTRVNSPSDFAIHNQYYYNAETGEVTIYIASFSVISAVKSTASKWEDDTVADKSWYNENDTEFTLKDVADFLGFRELVDEGNTFAGKTVTLDTDIDLNKKLFNPIGGGWAYNGGKTFNGTFDGGNHTIYNLRVNGWELDETGDKHSGTSMGAGLFSSIHNATIKNLAVVGSELIVETTSIGIIAGDAQGKCTFENIVVSDATLGNYQMRNGGIVGDIYVIESDNVPENEYSHTFTNIVVDSTVKLSSMWGDFDTGNGGVIGGKYGSAKVLMQNVIVAAELDVFSDVTAAYQWYAYRRCGMLVGYTGQNSPKQATNAAADFLTCENVSVYYGDWVNYTYYQFVEQTDEGGNRLWNSNYPWVRAQESPYNGPFSNVRYGNPIIDGEKINTLELAEKHYTDKVTITFDQLYGGGQGVYGTADHKQGGVNRSYSLPKTFYIKNNAGWTNLKLSYVYQNGEDTWTTIVDGIELFESNGVYRVDLPVGATSFTITADGGYKVEFTVANLTEKVTYNVHTHNFDNGPCSCGASQISKEYEFTLGENGSGGHKDSTKDTTTYTETNGGYTLSITSGTKFYPSSQDAQGNSCLKLGSGEATGSFSFVVPDNVTQVIICVAGYKANTVTVTVNDTSHTIETLSNNGKYTAITIDTIETKTITFATTSTGYRCMINTITFVATEISCAKCVMQTVEHQDASCGVAGYTLERCSVCGNEERTEYNALEHEPSSENQYICDNGCGTAINLPEAGSSVTLAEAELIAQAMGGERTKDVYKITGTITTELSGTDGATTLTDGTKNIYVVSINNYSDTGKGSVIYKDFANKDSFAKGNEIILYGNIGLQGDTVKLYGAYLTGHTDTTDDSDHNCDVCGAENVTEHNYVGGTCDCGVTEPTDPTPDPEPETPTTTTVSKSHTDIAGIAGVTPGQNTGVINGKEIKLDDYITIVCDKAKSGTAPTIYSESIRLYQGGATLTVKAEEGYVIKTIRITVANNSSGKGPISVEGGTASELTNLVYTITANDKASQIVITTTGTSSTTRVYVANIEVEYISTSSEGGETPACQHTNTTAIGEAKEATCTVDGITAGLKCADCGYVITEQETLEATGHTYVDGTCTGCGAEDPNAGGDIEPAEPETLATFAFGANGSASHNDGSSKTTYTETVDGYTLNITGGTNMYTGARDAKGNSCIKLGASSKAGSFSFTVPENVTKVIIYVAQYKANTTKITVNGTAYTITTASNNGAYTEIEIDTSVNKTVSFTTVSGGYRAMVNTIDFIGVAE